MPVSFPYYLTNYIDSIVSALIVISIFLPAEALFQLNLPLKLTVSPQVGRHCEEFGLASHPIVVTLYM